MLSENINTESLKITKTYDVNEPISSDDYVFNYINDDNINIPYDQNKYKSHEHNKICHTKIYVKYVIFRSNRW